MVQVLNRALDIIEFTASNGKKDVLMKAFLIAAFQY